MTGLQRVDREDHELHGERVVTVYEEAGVEFRGDVEAVFDIADEWGDVYQTRVVFRLLDGDDEPGDGTMNTTTDRVEVVD